MAATITRSPPLGAPALVESRCSPARPALHPSSSRRFVRARAARDAGDSQFTPDAAARLARAARLRRDLGLNYAGAVLACELLARIDELEARLRRYEPRPREVIAWTRTG